MVAETRLRDEIDEMLPGVIADRRDFHEHPELAYHEERTAGIVAERLRALGVDDIRTGIAGTGVTGLVHGAASGPGRVVLLRADMDALPIHEQNEVDYRSRTDGVMHACGHDAHTAMLLAVARLLMDRRDEFSGTVKTLFQPAEELPPGGAKPMIEAGVLEDPHVDAVFGLHIDQNSPLGVVSVRPGPYMAAADRFTIALKGKGGHGAHPHDTVDPVLIGAQIVTALQSLVSREIDPISSGVVSVTAFLAGEAFNVIPDSAELRGTVRTFTPENRDLLEKRIGELVGGIAAAMRADAKVDYNRGYPSTVNDPAMTDIVRQAAVETVGAEHVREGEPIMGAEDFSYFLQARPGSFFFVGSRNDERGLVWGHHHPRFDIDEAALAVGVETMTRVALDYLNGPA
ncbi:MAG TPA: amidohydrolase [Thermomicrobiales bacterium]|nr:amidohydrolase [Thermomicrobiales bacterium]